MVDTPCPRLIEVALPIREISAESVRDKSLRHGHISTLHLWWARRPLAASRAVVFASLVPDPDDPACPAGFRDAVTRLLRDDLPPVLKSYWRGRRKIADSDPYRPYDSKEIPDTPRNRLLTFIAKWSPEWLAFERGENPKQPPPAEMLDDRSLVKWETSDPANEQGRAVLGIARELVRLANGGEAPVVLDPFAGGGAIPLEAGRLGCQPIANDYNPVAYLILRATCEYPQKYGVAVEVRSQETPGQATDAQSRWKAKTNKGQMTLLTSDPAEVTLQSPSALSQSTNRLARDVEFWAKWILERARVEIGHLYPPGKDGMPVVGYLWARTAPCSNPTCRAEIPLLRSLLVCNKEGKHVALTITCDGQVVTFGIARDRAISETDGTMLGRGDCRCPICAQVTPVADLRRAGLDGKMGERMVAVITDTPHGKGYRPVEQTDLAAFAEARRLAEGVERPAEPILPEITSKNGEDISNSTGIRVHLYGMTTWGSLYNSRQLLIMQRLTSSLRDAVKESSRMETSAGYQQALGAYLGLWLSRVAQHSNGFCRWNSGAEKIQHIFGRQAIPMIWDYLEVPPFSITAGSPSNLLRVVTDFILHESAASGVSRDSAQVYLGDGARLLMEEASVNAVVTDPPYFDAIAYADLSDFSYVWLKRGLSDVFPEAFATPLTPKGDEATALKHRHAGDTEKAKTHCSSKLAACFAEARRVCSPDGVLTVMFAHQATEAWTSLIQALFEADLTITASYPIDTEMKTRQVAMDASALESSITVVCRRREVGEPAAFRDVRRQVEKAVSASVQRFWDYGFRGADLIVACYGPAVGVFGRYERVERADGTPVGVPELLQLVRESALKAIAGEFTGDSLSRLYFVWANLYGTGEQAWDDARLVVQVGGEAEDAMEVARRVELFVVEGATCRLALLRDRAGKRGLGADASAPLIDQLHHAMLLWKGEQRDELLVYLRDHELIDHAPFWKLAQALFEVLPRGEEDWKLISALLGERETLRSQVRRLGAV